MKYLTIVYALPEDYDVKELTSNPFVSGMSWSHLMNERDRLELKIKELENKLFHLKIFVNSL